MESIEISARTVEAAIEEALARLGKRRDEVEVKVLKEGSRGILGIGAEEARVLVSVLRALPAPVAVPPPPPPPTPLLALTPVAAEEEEPVTQAVEEVAPATRAEIAAKAQEVVTNLLHGMGIGATVALHQPEPQAPEDAEALENVIVDVTGDDLGILIGRRGETLASLQFITNLIVNRQVRPQRRIIVDVEHYRLRREATLRGLALRMAERVRYTHQAVTLEAMPPNERRIVHLTLKDSPYVATQSFGEGEARRVVISPKT
jgi:spoIIIJ-associated protein